MIVALELDRDIDLALFSRYLTQTGVPHRISEDGERQLVWTRDQAGAQQVQALYARIASGELALEAPSEFRAATKKFRTSTIFNHILRAPLTLVLILVNVVFFPVTFGIEAGEISAVMQAMTFLPFEIRGEYLYFADLAAVMAAGEYWRLLTPMFLHFGVMHIVFNLLWVWEVGRRIEAVNGTLMLFLTVVVTSLAANFSQYAMSGAGLFGGMSGVVFGLLGFALVWSRLLPRRDLGLPNGVYIFMLVFLALGFFGVFDFLLPGELANGAHLGGFVAGLTIGAVAAALERVGK